MVVSHTTLSSRFALTFLQNNAVCLKKEREKEKLKIKILICVKQNFGLDKNKIRTRQYRTIDQNEITLCNMV